VLSLSCDLCALCDLIDSGSCFVSFSTLLVPLEVETSEFYSAFKRVVDGSHLADGKFVVLPNCLQLDIPIANDALPACMWITAGTGIISGDESGYVTVRVGDYGDIRLLFNNPSSGTNTCGTEAPRELTVRCTISQGSIATAKYDVSFNVNGG
jgi:hypothetical protein